MCDYDLKWGVTVLNNNGYFSLSLTSAFSFQLSSALQSIVPLTLLLKDSKFCTRCNFSTWSLVGLVAPWTKTEGNHALDSAPTLKSRAGCASQVRFKFLADEYIQRSYPTPRGPPLPLNGAKIAIISISNSNSRKTRQNSHNLLGVLFIPFRRPNIGNAFSAIPSRFRFFFIPFQLSNSGNGFFSFPYSPFFSVLLQIPGNDSHWFPFPKCGNRFLQSRPRTSGMELAIPIPVLKLPFTPASYKNIFSSFPLFVLQIDINEKSISNQTISFSG